jgi:hypothetical protein
MQQRSCGQLLPLRIQRFYGLDVPSGVLLFGWHERQDRMCRGHIWNGRLDVVCVQWQLHMRGRVCVRRGERVRGRRGMPRGQLLCSWGLCAACRMYVRCRQLLPGWLNSCVGRQLCGWVLLRGWGLRAARRVHVSCGKLLWRGWLYTGWHTMQRGVLLRWRRCRGGAVHVVAGDVLRGGEREQQRYRVLGGVLLQRCRKRGGAVHVRGWKLLPPVVVRSRGNNVRRGRVLQRRLQQRGAVHGWRG